MRIVLRAGYVKQRDIDYYADEDFAEASVAWLLCCLSIA